MALKDRFPVKIYVDTIHPKAMEQFPDEWHGVINDTTLVEDDEERISVRAWTEFFNLQANGFSPEQAAKLVFADKSRRINRCCYVSTCLIVKLIHIQKLLLVRSGK